MVKLSYYYLIGTSKCNTMIIIFNFIVQTEDPLFYSADPKPELKPDPESEPEPEPDLEPDWAPEPDTEPGQAPEPDLDLDMDVF
jgi:hypothetical protein